MKKIRVFIENFQILETKFSIYLNRSVLFILFWKVGSLQKCQFNVDVA